MTRHGYDRTELTEKERATVNLLAMGLDRKSVARRLGCSARSVHRFTMSIRRKFGVVNDMQMALVAYRLGLIADEVITAGFRSDVPPEPPPVVTGPQPSTESSAMEH